MDLALDAPGDESALARALTRSQQSETEAEVSQTADSNYVLRFRRVGAGLPAQDRMFAGGTYGITGGLGGLGLRAAGLLGDHGATCLLLSSRSGLVKRQGQALEAQLASLRASRCAAVRVAAIDAGDTMDTRFWATCDRPLTGLLHASGVLQDGLLRSMAAGDIKSVFASKAVAAADLHHVRQ
jgi:hypothetical protein